eukprot:MONOS_13844.1-p1 / transcript=MONOS_13844.1 / gene=MONOS_13844 / organism=Monocercomonoides_exilis_PA203 / gene_product=unspecified product / transcript_product=unspecified product / location=Mono_scaffold00892:21064-23798(+) / protein_length=870 / sequence_SO=supercontig / SO=protein_coding / is_pseudo=false
MKCFSDIIEAIECKVKINRNKEITNKGKKLLEIFLSECEKSSLFSNIEKSRILKALNNLKADDADQLKYIDNPPFETEEEMQKRLRSYRLGHSPGYHVTPRHKQINAGLIVPLDTPSLRALLGKEDDDANEAGAGKESKEEPAGDDEEEQQEICTPPSTPPNRMAERDGVLPASSMSTRLIHTPATQHITPRTKPVVEALIEPLRIKGFLAGEDKEQEDDGDDEKSNEKADGLKEDDEEIGLYAYQNMSANSRKEPYASRAKERSREKVVQQQRNDRTFREIDQLAESLITTDVYVNATYQFAQQFGEDVIRKFEAKTSRNSEAALPLKPIWESDFEKRMKMKEGSSILSSSGKDEEEEFCDVSLLPLLNAELQERRESGASPMRSVSQLLKMPELIVFDLMKKEAKYEQSERSRMGIISEVKEDEDDFEREEDEDAEEEEEENEEEEEEDDEEEDEEEERDEQYLTEVKSKSDSKKAENLPKKEKESEVSSKDYPVIPVLFEVVENFFAHLPDVADLTKSVNASKKADGKEKEEDDPDFKEDPTKLVASEIHDLFQRLCKAVISFYESGTSGELYPASFRLSSFSLYDLLLPNLLELDAIVSALVCRERKGRAAEELKEQLKRWAAKMMQNMEKEAQIREAKREAKRNESKKEKEEKEEKENDKKGKKEGDEIKEGKEQKEENEENEEEEEKDDVYDDSFDDGDFESENENEAEQSEGKEKKEDSKEDEDDDNSMAKEEKEGKSYKDLSAEQIGNSDKMEEKGNAEEKDESVEGGNQEKKQLETSNSEGAKENEKEKEKKDETTSTPQKNGIQQPKNKSDSSKIAAEEQSKSPESKSSQKVGDKPKEAKESIQPMTVDNFDKNTAVRS